MIALWTAWLDTGPARTDLLDDDERARAARFRHAIDRNRFVARRTLLRSLLGRELGRAPQDIAYELGNHGKPIVAGGGDLRFSSSHSHGLWLCALARGAEVGCDVERIDPALADRQVADRLFAPGETRRLAALPPEHYAAGFFACWTRKEAFVKAIALGLSYPLAAFEVTCGPGVPARLVSGGDGWGLHAVVPAAGWCAAVAGPAGTAIGEPREFSRCSSS